MGIEIVYFPWNMIIFHSDVNLAKGLCVINNGKSWSIQERKLETCELILYNKTGYVIPMYAPEIVMFLGARKHAEPKNINCPNFY